MLVVLSSAVGDVERGGMGRVGGMTSEVPMGRHALITKGKRDTNKFIDGTGFHQPGSQPPPPTSLLSLTVHSSDEKLAKGP